MVQYFRSSHAQYFVDVNVSSFPFSVPVIPVGLPDFHLENFVHKRTFHV